MKENYVFFLGGHDLEMDTIYDLLKNLGYTPHDKQLPWGCKASMYEKEIEDLEPEQIPVLIELILDIDLPPSKIIIDHHNDHHKKDSSLEQVASLLKVQLTEEQFKYAINDKFYIHGLEKLKLEREEILRIRKKDRLAQKVTLQDECQSKMCIEKHLEIIDDDCAIIVNAPSQRTAIKDILYESYEKMFYSLSKLFVISEDKSFTFYGQGEIVNMLRKKYSIKKEKDNSIEYYFGGDLPSMGYFGSNKSLTNEEIIELVKRPVYSQHIFLFPFTISEEVDKKEEIKNTFYNKVEQFNSMENSHWEKADFKITETDSDKLDTITGIKYYNEDEIWKYNELAYFYNYINNELFGYNKSESNERNTYCYKITLKKDKINEIHYQIKEYFKTKTYILTVDEISLRLFDTGVGILSLTLLNKHYPEFETILKFNDYCRRIYPQYLGKMGTTDTKGSFLPEKISVYLNAEKGSNPFAEDDFITEDYFNKINFGYAQKPDSNYFKCADYISKLLNPLKTEEYRSIIDDRMYTLCWYGNHELISKLNGKCSENDGDLYYEYEKSDDWYKYIYLDSGEPLVQSKKMKCDLIKKTTYPRFVEWNTIFGVTRYSFMCLTNRSDTAYNLIRNHMQKMYYQMAVFLLVQRAAILNYNCKIEEISRDIQNIKEKPQKETMKRILGRIETLQGDIIEFSNNYWHSEITPQEEGIELYNLARTSMNIDEELKIAKNKINDLHSYADILNQRRNGDEIEALTRIGIIYFPLTLIVAVGGLEGYFRKDFFKNIGLNITSLFLFIFAAAFIMRLTYSVIKGLKEPSLSTKEKEKKKEKETTHDNPLYLIRNALKDPLSVVFLIIWVIAIIFYICYKN